MVVRIVSEYEAALERVFAERGHRSGDQEVGSFFARSIERRFRSPDLSKIHTMLQQMSVPLRDSFMASYSDQAKAAWDNMMRARHAVVHRNGTLQLTLMELHHIVPLTQSVIDELLNILGTPTGP